MSFIFYVHFSINIGTWNNNLDLFDHFWVNNITTESQTSKFGDSGFKLPFTVHFHFSFTIITWNTSLGPFWPCFVLKTSPRESKLQYFENVISEANSSIQISIKYWFQSFYHPRYMIFNFVLFLPNLEIMMSQKKYIFQLDLISEK